MPLLAIRGGNRLSPNTVRVVYLSQMPKLDGKAAVGARLVSNLAGLITPYAVIVRIFGMDGKRFAEADLTRETFVAKYLGKKTQGRVRLRFRLKALPRKKTLGGAA